MIILDGSRGEGGGQIVRSAITLSTITGTPVQIENIRAGRNTPGLRAQHATAIQAAAQLCDATLEGVQIGSPTIRYEPGAAVKPGQYEWHVGTAGSVPLVIQTVLLALVLAEGDSEIRVNGGTHVPHSPSGHYLRDVFTPALLGMGADVEMYIDTTGWVPEGGGTMTAIVRGGQPLRGRDMIARGSLERVFGTAIGCNLPSHIPQRIANRAINLLDNVDVDTDIRAIRTRSASSGAGIFLALEYFNGRGGFGVLGKRGMPSEVVAEKGVNALLDFDSSGAAVDHHLADQLVLPMALAEGRSAFSTNALTAHLRTNLEVIGAFIDRPITVDSARHIVTIE